MYLIVIGDTRMVGGITKMEVYEADDFSAVIAAACEFGEELLHVHIIVTEHKDVLIDLFMLIEDQIEKMRDAYEVVDYLLGTQRNEKSFIIFTLETTEGSTSGFLRIYEAFGDYANIFNKISKELESELKNKEKIEELLNNEVIAEYFGESGMIKARILLEAIHIEPNCASEIVEIVIEDLSGYSYIRFPIQKLSLDEFQTISSVEQLLRFLKRTIIDNEDLIAKELTSAIEGLEE